MELFELSSITPPAGSDTQIQFNNSGVFGANSILVWDDTNNRFGIGTASPGSSIDTKLHIQFTTATADMFGIFSELSTSTDSVDLTGMQYTVKSLGADNNIIIGAGGSAVAVLNDNNTVTGVRGVASASFNPTNCTFVGVEGGAFKGVGAGSVGYDFKAVGSTGIAFWASLDDHNINFGAGEDAGIYFNGTDLIIDPDLVGVGKVLIGATGDDTLVAANIGVGKTPGVNFEVDGETAFTPSATQNIVAGTGITGIANTIIQIQGSGGAVDITASPQIEAGIDGQLLILHGESDTNTVQLDNGTGLHIHGKYVMGHQDSILLYYHDEENVWTEITRNAPESEKAWTFLSPSGGTGTFYTAGFYDFGASDNDFNPAITHGTANTSYAVHVFVVQAAGGAGGTDTVVRVSGTSITDGGVRTTSDTEDLTVDDAGAAGAYYETAKKWIGQVTLTKQSGPDLLMNYGFAKYWDNNNSDYRITGLDATGRAGANDAAPQICLRHHKATGWTYNSGSTPDPPTTIADMNTDHNTEIQFTNGEYFAWKRDNLLTSIAGSNGEGLIIEFTTTANKAIEIANMLIRVRSN